jgi:hypothetical protein
MPVSVAAIKAGKAANKRRKELEQRKKENAKQEEADGEAAALHFDQLDTSKAGVLDAAGAERLLLLVTGHTVIDHDGLAMVVNCARKTAGSGMLPDGDPMPREAVLQAVRRYRYYLRHRKFVDGLIGRWDLNLDAGLDREEVMKLILDRERNLKDKREVGGIIVELEPDEADIEYILQECDANGNGLIERAELLPALAAWAELAEKKLAAQRSSMCALL